MDKNSRKLRVYTGGHSWLHPPLHTCPSVLVTLTTVAVNAPMTSTFHALLHLLQRWASIRVKWEKMEECWEAVERALPGRGRRTLRLLEQNLVSVREGKCLKILHLILPGTYRSNTHSPLLLNFLHMVKKKCSKSHLCWSTIPDTAIYWVNIMATFRQWPSSYLK